MREILFTGKRVDNNEWVKGYVSVFGDTTQIFVPFTEEEIKENQGHFLSAVDGVWHIVDPETVGEYVDLVDKNGNKIFEGHIVKNEYGLKASVTFSRGSCYPFIAFPEYNSWDSDECEIIGNIYDSSELLRK